MKRTEPSCGNSEATSLLAAGALHGEGQRAAEAHLAGCAECRQYYPEIAAVAGQLAGWEGHVSNVSVSARAQHQWANAVHAAAEPQSFPRKIWLELIWPCRHIWTTVAALWVAILFVNAQLSESHGIEAAANPSNGWAMADFLREENQVLAELAAPPLPAASGAQPAIMPGPRSERAFLQVII